MSNKQTEGSTAKLKTNLLLEVIVIHTVTPHIRRTDPAIGS